MARLLLLALAVPATAVTLGVSPAAASVPAGTLSFVAGTGQSGAPVPGPALASSMDNPYGVAVDGAGNVYIADQDNHRVEKVTPSGQLSIVAGDGNSGTLVAGPALSAHVHPDFVAADRAGNLFVADSHSHRVAKVTPAGALTIIGGNGSYGAPTAGPATSSPLGDPYGIAVGPDGSVYVPDYTQEVVAKITPGGTLSIVAGTGSAGPPTAGPATSSMLNNPEGTFVDAAGNLYIADYGNNQVEKVTPGGSLSIVAGTGTSGSPVPGPAVASPLDEPSHAIADAAGNVYIADSNNNVIEKVTPGGQLSIFAGNGQSDDATEGPALSSALDYPTGLALDATGNVYIADDSNNRIEKVTVTDPDSSIAAKYNSLGAASSFLGASVGSQVAFPGGVAQLYQHGAIFYSAATGAHELHGAILQHWLALGALRSPLGLPTSDESTTADSAGRFNTFAGGRIYWSQATGAHEVHGSNLARYTSLGFERGPLGYPTTDESTTPDGAGRFNHFTGGSIYWTPAAGSYAVQGQIRNHWAALGWERSVVGYPITNELGTPDGHGRYNHFTSGSIYWTPTTGAHEVHGSIRQAWAALGWETSSLGYPTSDEYAIPGGRRSDFQHGSITYTAATGQVTLTTR